MNRFTIQVFRVCKYGRCINLGYKVTVMVVTKVTAFSTSREHSRGRLTHGSHSSGSDESDGFFKYFYTTYHHQNNPDFLLRFGYQGGHTITKGIAIEC